MMKGRGGQSRFFSDNSDQYAKFCQQLVPHETVHDLSASVADWDFDEDEGMVDEASCHKKINIDSDVMEAKLDKFFADHGSQEEHIPRVSATSDLLDDNFILGECHGSESPKRFLIDNMQALKDNGFDTLYLEHLFYDNQQDLDNFFRTGEMSALLKEQLGSLDSGHMNKDADDPNTFTQLVIAAQKVGIRVVAIDTAATYSQQNPPKHAPVNHTANTEAQDRHQYFSYTACQIIGTEEAMKRHAPQQSGGAAAAASSDGQAQAGKFVALMGNSHVSEYNGVLGVGELLGVRRVIVHDADSRATDKCSVKFDKSDRFHMHAEVLVTLGTKADATKLLERLAPEKRPTF